MHRRQRQRQRHTTTHTHLQVANVKPELYKKTVNTFRAGTTAPILGNKFWKKAKVKNLQALSHFAYHQSMDVILEPVWTANATGV
jgi:hypothetical protein